MQERRDMLLRNICHPKTESRGVAGKGSKRKIVGPVFAKRVLHDQVRKDLLPAKFIEPVFES
jgi:hypothetical protein